MAQKKSKLVSMPLTLLLIIILAIIFIGVRFYNLPQVVNFGSDQGRDFLAARQIFLDKQITLIGPPSEYTINGRQFFFGPAPYYFILPALVVSNWNPLSVSYFMILLNGAALLTSVILLNKYVKRKMILYVFALLCSVTPAVVEYSQSYWNPYLMLPVSLVLVSLLFICKYKLTNSLLLFSLIGFLFGLGLQFHYSFILAIILSVIWLIVNKQVTIKSSLSILGGFIVGFLPVIIFELRNNFYNTNTLFLLLKNSPRLQSSFNIHSFYFISLLPFLFFFLSWIIVKKLKLDNHLLSAGLLIYSVVSVTMVGLQKTPPLSYPALQQATQTILQNHPTEFNIVDQLTGDNRAMALRYLLTVQNSEPLSVTDYPKAKVLYVYSKEPLTALLKSPVWEISSAQTKTVTQTWGLQDHIYVYKLTK